MNTRLQKKLRRRKTEAEARVKGLSDRVLESIIEHGNDQSTRRSPTAY